MAAEPTPRAGGLRHLPRNVWVMTLTSLLTDISSEMVFNLLPLFLANVLGVRTSVIGLIEGIAETTASLFKVFSGWFSDRLGRRKWLTVAGYGLSTAAKPFLAIVTSWPGVLAVRFTDRMGKGLRTAPRDALVADSVTADQRGLAFGLHRAGDTLGAFLGTGIALLLVLAAGTQTRLLSQQMFQTVVLVSIIPALLAVLALAFGARDIPRPAAAAPPRLNLREMPPAFLHFVFIVIVFTLGNSADAFLILRAQERGLSLPGVLAMLMTFTLVYTLVSGPAGALSDRIGRRRLITAGWLVYSLIYLGFAAADTAGQIWALYGCYGVYYGIFEGAAKAFVADLVPAEKRGTAYGIYNAAVGLAALPASLLAGIVWQGIGDWPGFGASAPFGLGAALAACALALLLRWQPTR